MQLLPLGGPWRNPPWPVHRHISDGHLSDGHFSDGTLFRCHISDKGIKCDTFPTSTLNVTLFRQANRTKDCFKLHFVCLQKFGCTGVPLATAECTQLFWLASTVTLFDLHALHYWYQFFERIVTEITQTGNLKSCFKVCLSSVLHSI